MKIRAATSKDVPALQRLYAVVDRLHADAVPHVFVDLPSGRPADFVRCKLAEAGTMLVAESSGRVVGFTSIRPREAPEAPVFRKRNYLHVEELVVDAAFHRTGVGTALMRGAEQWARERGFARIQLTVWSFNAGAIALYELLGYSTDLLVMSRDVP